MKKSLMKKTFGIIFLIIILGIAFVWVEYNKQKATISINPLLGNYTPTVSSSCSGASLKILNAICSGQLNITIENTGSVNLGKIFPTRLDFVDSTTIFAGLVVDSDLLPGKKIVLSTIQLNGTIDHIKVVSNSCQNAQDEIFENLTC